LKSLEVSEEKANQRVEEFKRQLKSLTLKLKEAENRAEYAEKTVKKLQKEVDRLEGMFLERCQNSKHFFFFSQFYEVFSFIFSIDSKSKQNEKKFLRKFATEAKKIYAKLFLSLATFSLYF
jgi:hypothetical protein